MTRRLVVVAVALATLSASACAEDDLGAPCGPAAADRVIVEPGRTDVVQSVAFTCTSTLCMSLRGSEPFCTRACVDDTECRPGYRCEVAVVPAPDGGTSLPQRLCTPGAL